jgi:hypothetical protein
VSDAVKRTGGSSVVGRTAVAAGALLIIIFASAVPGLCQASPDLLSFFRQDIGLSDDQIAAISSGRPVAKALDSRTPAEVFLLGAVYINASPDAYYRFARDVNRLRHLPYTMALEQFSNPPQLSDLDGFSFDDDDVQALKKCQPGDCAIQMPASSILTLQRSIDWSAANVDQQVNGLLHKTALQDLLAYQRGGDEVLGEYDDKPEPTAVAQQFAYMLSYVKVLPQRLPDFYHYLLSYPNGKPANAENMFYWSRVKFGFKPTLRVVQVISMRGKLDDDIACAIAEKQLYSSHYFETALDMSFCVRGHNPARPGFYLIVAMGSEQAGLTGVKGTIIRHFAVGRSVSNLEVQLADVKSKLESNR